MTDISAFPSITQVCDRGHQNSGPYTAGATIKAGMVVAYARTGVTDTVHPHKKGTTGSVVGVAAEDASTGDWLNVYEDGAVCYLANADDTTGIDAGAVVEGNDNAVGGTISAATGAATTAEASELMADVVGMALEDIAGGATGRVKIRIGATNRNQG